jgi:adenine-specific DNA-methyltransferase
MPVLQFKGKTAVENHHRTVPHHALEFDAKLSLLPKGEAPSLEGNLIIEGDNLLALKALLPTHAGRIKCIYIDPPYNTGNEGWVYNDNLTQPQFKEWIGQTVGKESEDACRHDKWCCMMYPRLQLLRELLRDDGAVFVSIDDNEVHHLRMLLDEVFGIDNFVACACWQKKYSASNDHQGVAPMHDFLLIYRRSEAFERNLLPRTHQQDKAYKNPDDDPRGSWKPADYTCNKTKEERPNLFYSIRNPFTEKDVWPDEKRVWAYSEDVTEDNIAKKLLWWGKDGSNSTPALKNLLSDVQAGLVPTTWWPQEDVGHTDEAKKEVQRILGTLGATITPKPVDLLRRVLRIATAPNDIVLDSFAGSGTTGHATLALNKEDGGNRRFVLIQMPFDNKEDEKKGLNVCQHLTLQRVARTIKGYEFSNQAGKKNKVEGLGGSFTYARLGPRLFGEYKVWEKEMPAPEELAKYIFYTETSREFQPKDWQKKTGRVGEHKGTAFYLLYAPEEKEGRGLDTAWLATVGQAEKCKRLVVYCEKVWLHREDREKWEHTTGKSLRAMQLPMGLK